MHHGRLGAPFLLLHCQSAEPGAPSCLPQVAEHGLQPIAEADAADTGEEFDDSMFQDAAAVAQSLEQRLPPLPADPQHEDAASVHSTHSSLSMGSGEFNLGRVTAVRSSRNSSRLRAPRGSFHFFDKNAPVGTFCDIFSPALCLQRWFNLRSLP